MLQFIRPSEPTRMDREVYLVKHEHVQVRLGPFDVLVLPCHEKRLWSPLIIT